MYIRRLREEEMEYSIRMSEFAFQYELTEKEREERKAWVAPENTWVAEENGEILAKSTTLPLSVYIFGEKVPMGGVSGVVTWPEHRRGGLVKHLLLHSLEEMRKEGQILSFLYPFSIPFYRKMGWELFAEQQIITLTKEQLPAGKKGSGKVRRVENDLSLVDDVYQTWAKRYLGTLARDERWWNINIFKRKKGTLAVYYNEGNEAKGYMIYQVKENKMTIKELIWLDTEARDSLFAFISDHDSMLDKVEWNTMPHSGLPFILRDPKVERKLVSYFMARIVDVKEFLKIYPFNLEKGSEPLVLHVSDEFCSWNNGTYFLSGGKDDKELKFFPAKESGACQHPPKKGLSLSVQTLTAVLMNAQSVSTLYEEGLLLGTEEEVQHLERAVPAKQPFFYDFF